MDIEAELDMLAIEQGIVSARKEILRGMADDEAEQVRDAIKRFMWVIARMRAREINAPKKDTPGPGQ